jgi:hypothetical protein
MVNVNVVGGYDGVTDPAGMTNQSTTSTLNIGAALESYGGGTLGIASTPAGNSYLGWSIVPEDSIASNAHTTTQGFLVRVVAATGGPCGHIDVVTVSTTYTNCVFGLYSGASFATGPLVWTADQHANFGVAGLVSMTWNGASSPASVNLIAGQTYWVYYELTGTSPVLAGATTTAGAAAFNPNLTASATNACNSMNLTAAAPSTLASNTTLAPQTSWVTYTGKAWIGLKA